MHVTVSAAAAHNDLRSTGLFQLCNITDKGVGVAVSLNIISPIGRLKIGLFSVDGKRGTDTNEPGGSPRF